MASASYDTLTIVINADSKEASRSINKLSNNLNKLNDTAKNLNTRRIGEIKGLLLNIAKIDFSNVSKGLQDVVSAFKYFNNKTAQKNSPILSVKELDKQMSAYTSFAKNVQYVFDGANNNEADTKAIEKNLDKAEDKAKKTLKYVNELNEKTKNVASQFAKMFKNILKYRVVRRLIQTIFQEIQNAFSQLASVDQDFNNALGEIKSALSYVARVLVSIIAPIIKVIAPIITMIAEAIGMIGNALGSAFAGALGQSEFAEAEEKVESYTDSLKKAKNVSMGFDKLNVISQEDSGGYKMTDVANGSGALADVITKIKNILEPLLQELAPQISALMVKVVNAIEKIAPLIEVILDLVYDLVHLTDDSVNGSVGAFIDSLGSAFYLIGMIAKILEPILKVLNVINAVVLNIINWVIELLATGLGTIFETIGAILEIVIAFFEGDTKKIEQIWNNLLKSLFAKWEDFGRNFANFFIKIWNNIVSFVENAINKIIDSVNEIGKYTGGWSIPHVDFSGVKGTTLENVNTSNGASSFSYQSNTPNGNGNSTQNIVVEIDGKEIARAVNKQNANSGTDFLMGGNINYGKGY